jgi:lipopolysaccharide exporter
MGYSRVAVSGFGWQAVLKVGTAVVTIFKLFVLARLLGPKDFGLFSLVAITLGVSEALTETGINITILQSKNSILYFLNTAFVISIVRGLLIGVFMTVLGMWLGSFYHEPMLPMLITMAALVPIIKGFINPAIVSLQKNLMFFQDSAYRFSLILVEAVLSVLLATSLGSVSALVFSLIGASLFEVLISFVFFSQRPRFALVVNRAKEILSNSKGLTLSAVFSYLFQNADDAIVGKTLGTSTLGLYHNGYALGHKLTYEVAQATHHGTLPILSKISDDLPRSKRAFVKSMLVTLGLATALSSPLFIAPTFIVENLLSEKWLPVVPILPIMAAAGILSSFALGCYSLLIAQKKYFLMNAHLGLTTLLMICFLLMAGTTGSLVNASWAILWSRLLPVPILILGITKLFKKS